MTPFTVELDQVAFMKFRPGIKMVLGPEISVAVANCTAAADPPTPLVKAAKLLFGDNMFN